METENFKEETARELLLNLKNNNSSNEIELKNQIDTQSILKSFIINQFKKIEDSIELEKEIKNRIKEQLSEASFSQLIRLLTVVQEGNNTAINNIFTPFLTNLSIINSDFQKREDVNVSDISKDTIQSLDELYKLITIIKNKSTIMSQEEKINSMKEELDDMKKMLKNDLKE